MYQQRAGVYQTGRQQGMYQPGPSPVDEYAAEVNEVIEKVLLAKHFQVKLKFTVKGPATYSSYWKIEQWSREYRCHVPLDDIGLGMVQRQDSTIGHHVGLRMVGGKPPIWISSDQKLTLVQYNRPDPLDLRPWNLVKTDSWEVLPLGLDAYNEGVGIDLRRTPSVLLIGPTQAGKSTSIRTAMWAALHLDRKQIRIGVVSSKLAEDFYGLAGADTVMALADSSNKYKQAEGLIKWAVHELEVRRASGKRLPYILLVFDDMFNLLLEREDFLEPIMALFAQGAAFGFRVLMGSQRSGVKGVGGMMIAGNAGATIVLGAKSAGDASLFAGVPDTGAERLQPYSGDAIYVDSGGEVRRILIANTKADDLLRATHGVMAKRGGLSDLRLPANAEAVAAPAAPLTLVSQAPARPAAPVTRTEADWLRDPRFPLAYGPIPADRVADVRAVWDWSGGKLLQTKRIVWGRRKDDGTVSAMHNEDTSKWLYAVVNKQECEA